MSNLPPPAPYEPHGFMDGVDWQHEVGHAMGGNKIYPSVDDLKENSKCWAQCGIVEVKVQLVRWVADQDFHVKIENSPSSEIEPTPAAEGTPRTEAMIDSCGDYEKAYHYNGRFADFARTLERELAEAKELIATISQANDSVNAEALRQCVRADESESRLSALEADAQRYRWLTEDHDDFDTRTKCHEILERIYAMSYSAVSAAIDAARTGVPNDR